jgi:hypothetical protein
MAVLIAGKHADFQCCSYAWNNLQPTRLPLQKQLFLENDAGDCVMFGMAESDERRSYASLCRKCFRGPRENEKRFAALFFSDVDVAPTHCLANACAERFCNRFLSRKTRSKMARGEFHRHGIFNLTIRKNAVQKTVSESVNGTLNARALDKIDTDSNYAHVSGERTHPA